jgi:hypothetical protein
VVVEGDVEVAPGEPTELQYLVRWADAGAQLPPVASAEGDDADGEQAPADTEWLAAEFVAENVIECVAAAPSAPLRPVQRPLPSTAPSCSRRLSSPPNSTHSPPVVQARPAHSPPHQVAATCVVARLQKNAELCGRLRRRDYEAGLEYCDAEALVGKKQVNY